MTRPRPTPLLHFTHVAHLPTVVRDGLLSDSAAQRAGLIQVEVGHHDIKAKRRRRVVPVPPGGVVADYAPFYFAPRSPMMSAISHGRVPTYTDGCADLVYLVTTVERLAELGLPLVFTDRNAVLDLADFTGEVDRLDTLVDWPLMRARMWKDTAGQPDRKERRMAECLVHERVPWSAFSEVVAGSPACARRAVAAISAQGGRMSVAVRPEWYI